MSFTCANVWNQSSGVFAACKNGRRYFAASANASVTHARIVPPKSGQNRTRLRENVFLTILDGGLWTFAAVAGTVLVLQSPLVAASEILESTNTVAMSVVTEIHWRDARRIALEQNWDLLAARANVDIAEAQKLVAAELPNPTLSLSTTKIPSNGNPASTPLGNSLIHRSYDSVVALNQLIEIGGKRGARKASALAGYQGASARFAEARRQLDLAVTSTYVSVLAAEQQVQVLRASAGSLRREAAIAQERVRVGDLSLADRDQITIAADRLELDAVRAESDAQSARIQLETLLGYPSPDGHLKVADSLSDLAQVLEIPVQTETKSSILSRPDVVAAQTDVAKAKSDLKLQKALRIPDPTVLAQYERQPPDASDTVGFGFSFPLPLFNLNKGNISSARATLDQAEIRARQAVANAAADVAIAEHELRSTRERKKRFENDIAPRSAAIAETVRYSYQKGGASLIDLLSAERNDNDVRLALSSAIADYINAQAAYAAASSATERFQLPGALLRESKTSKP